MDYEQEYNASLEQAKKELATCGSMDCDAARLIFRLFPQLRKEEEPLTPFQQCLNCILRGVYYAEVPDEKVNEFILNVVRTRTDELIKLAKKQEEQKHPDGCFTCDEYKKGYEAGRLNGVTAGYNKAMKEVEQKEQKPWKVGTNAYFTPEQKPTEVDESTKRLNDNWMKQHFDDYKEQKPAEWSEEDEKMLEEIINHIDTTSVQRIPARPGSDIGKSWIKFLKSIRPHWKPSEEQMSILKKAVEHYRNDWVGATIKEQNTLTSLYEQLKKLGVKEEPEYYQHFDPDC